MEIGTKRNRTRFKMKMLSKLPRVSINKTNQYFSAQLIDVASEGKVVAAIHEKTFVKAEKATKLTPVERIGKMGESLGKTLLAAGITAVAYDRSGYVYHGKVKAFADGLRKSGLTL